MLNIVLFGPPGAGKGTQALLLRDKYQLQHLSTGDLLRKEIALQTEQGIEAAKYIDKGELVPDQLVIAMIEHQINLDHGARGVIFDGFPRTVQQAKALDQLMEDINQKVAGMLALDVDKQELIERLLERGKTSGRSDDCSVEIIENRINVYLEKTAPLKAYYDQQGKYIKVNGSGSIEAIAERLDAAVNKL